MTDSEKNWRSAPPFDHVLYGLPSEVAAVAAEEQQTPRSLLGTRRRKVVAAGLTAVLVVGSVSGAYAVHERTQQTETAQKTVLAVSRDDLHLAAELDEARDDLTGALTQAREVRDASRDVLADAGVEPDDVLAGLDEAIADGTLVLDRATDVADLDDVLDATAALRAATETVEGAVDEQSRETLSEALLSANDALTRSAGIIFEQLRTDLSDAVERAQAALESDDATPAELVEHAQEVAELTQPVIAAVESVEQERLLQEQQPVIPPAPSGGSSSRDEGTSGGTTPTRPSRPSPSPSEDEPPAAPTPSPAPTEQPEPTPTEPPPPAPPTEDPVDPGEPDPNG